MVVLSIIFSALGLPALASWVAAGIGCLFFAGAADSASTVAKLSAIAERAGRIDQVHSEIYARATAAAIHASEFRRTLGVDIGDMEFSHYRITSKSPWGTDGGAEVVIQFQLLYPRPDGSPTHADVKAVACCDNYPSDADVSGSENFEPPVWQLRSVRAAIPDGKEFIFY
eukprot:Rmarinus@m.16061